MDIENEYVLDVYDNIADHFSDTRFCTWDFVDKFINKRTPEERGIEIGCGNGKNLCIREDLNIIGVDTCKKFIDICNEKGLRAFHQNCCNRHSLIIPLILLCLLPYFIIWHLIHADTKL